MERLFALVVTAILVLGLLPIASLASALQRPGVAATTPHDTAGIAVQPTSVDGADPRALLDQVEPKAVLSAPLPYYRDDYQPRGWFDSDGDCQSDRHEVLIAESQATLFYTANGCRVETGLWADRLDGRTYTDASQVEVDHTVALSAAHQAGAWQWDIETKQRFAHDLGYSGSLVVTGSANNQAKADRRPDQWQPPSQAAWCAYATDWVLVKVRWGLDFAITEVQALVLMLDTCPQPTTN